VQSARPNITQVGAEIARCLSSRDEPSALRLALRFVEQFEREGGDCSRLLDDRPDPTGDVRFDALLAAVAEYSCARAELPPPAWVDEEERFLSVWWFPSGLTSLHADAIAHSPISFARRGIFIASGALSCA